MHSVYIYIYTYTYTYNSLPKFLESWLSFQVDSSWSTGDYEGAQRAARSAKRWDIVAIGTGVVLAVIGGFMMVLSIIQYARDISYLNRVNSLNNMYHDDVNVSYMYYGQTPNTA